MIFQYSKSLITHNNTNIRTNKELSLTAPLKRREIMVVKKRKVFLITTFLIIAAIVVVLFVGYFTGEKKVEYEGTLVEVETEYRS